MSVKMSNNEYIVKQYDYATTTVGLINKRETHSSLIITNKRIIKKENCDKMGYEKLNVSEIPVNAITAVNTKMSSGFKFAYLVWGIILALSGLITFIAGCNAEDNAVLPIILGLAFMVGGGFLIYKFFTARVNAVVYTFVVADRLNIAMSSGSVSFNNLFPVFNLFNTPKFVKVVVDANTAKDMVNELGAWILNIQDSTKN